jgi:hypothetical protein
MYLLVSLGRLSRRLQVESFPAEERTAAESALGSASRFDAHLLAGTLRPQPGRPVQERAVSLGWMPLAALVSNEDHCNEKEVGK